MKLSAKLSVPIFLLKRRAKLLARAQGLPRHEALDRVAREEGYRAWSHLAASRPATRPAATIAKQLRAGDMLLLAARPGHGKTLLGLELASAATASAQDAFFFTLDYNEGDVLARLQDLGIDSSTRDNRLSIDTSDEISSDYIIRRMGRTKGPALVVIDYLQALDQKRRTPALETQVSALKSYVRASGSIVVAISQIDRSFELQTKALPDISDVRLPNPCDLSLFNKTCFLHEGEIHFGIAA